MEKIKLLLADDNRECCSKLISGLDRDEFDIVGIASNGKECLDMLSATKVDVLLLDIVMPEIDGFGVLEALASNDIKNKPHVFMASNLNGDTFINKAVALGAEYYFVKPVDADALRRRIADIYYTMPNAANSRQDYATQSLTSSSNFNSSAMSSGANRQDYDLASVKRYGTRAIDEKIANLFLSVGIPAHIKGYQFLRDAIKLVVRDQTYINSITKRLYPSIATTFETSSSKVERAIRHAIEVAWNRGKIENINKLFGFKIYGSNDKPTNGEFIALVADKLLLEGNY